ncbi:MAG: beta-propeller domain-containing protein [Myxococcales bacterium]|nr:beta-propeller domain-containing protein [Myxococcales bacterium]
MGARSWVGAWAGARRRALVGWAALLALGACVDAERDPRYDTTDFESAGFAGSGGSPPAADAGAGRPDEDGADRVVEEADLYRVIGDRLYVLNSYRGLFVFDVSDPDAPRELGRMPLVGQPVEMYVRGGRAYVIMSDYFTYWYLDDAFAEAGLAPYFGSRIVAIDMSDPTAPFEIGDVLLDGYVADTRLVGDVLYAVANRYAWWGHYGVRETETRDLTALTSIDVGDPTRIRQVQQLTFEGNGWHVHATPDAFIIAGSADAGGWGWRGDTEVRYVDISDPAGAMAARGAVAFPGSMRDDTSLHVHDDEIRVLLREHDGLTTRLRILDGADPDALPVLGEMTYEYPGQVFGTTFTADRLYMIHYEVIDPLEIVDLRDPTDPHITAILEMPGWVERIAVDRDERLIGLGVDDSEGTRRTSLTLFDVSDPGAPELLARENVEATWSWSVATWERKAWTVDWEEGLVLFPWSGWEATEDPTDGPWGGRYHHALSIVEIGDAALTTRGAIEAPATVERGFLHEGRVYALSQSALQVVDIRDRARPAAGATLELARNIGDYVRTSRAGVELVQRGLDGWYGASQGASLRLSPLDTPDGAEELARVELPRGTGALVPLDDDHVAVLALGRQSYDARGASQGGVTVVNVRDPGAPRIVGDVALPPTPTMVYEPVGHGWIYDYTSWQAGYGAPWGSWGGVGEPMLALGGGRYGLVRTRSWHCGGLEACRSVGIDPTSSESWGGERWYYGTRYQNELVVVDLADPGRPVVRGPFSLGEGLIERPYVDEGALVLSHALPSRVDEEGRTWVRWFYERWSLDGPRPSLEEVVNVPGVVLDVRGRELITVDQRWADGYSTQLALAGLVVEDGRARLRSELTLGAGWVSGLVVDGSVGYVVRASDRGETTLDTLDLARVDALRVGQTLRLDTSGWWSIAALTEHAAVLRGGWGSGLALFDRAPTGLTFRRHVRTHGWSTSLREMNDVLWLSKGPWGLQAVPLE